MAEHVVTIIVERATVEPFEIHASIPSPGIDFYGSTRDEPIQSAKAAYLHYLSSWPRIPDMIRFEVDDRTVPKVTYGEEAVRGG